MSLPESDPKFAKQPERNTAVSPPKTYTYSYYAGPPEPTGLQAYKPQPHQVQRASQNQRSTRWHYFPIAAAGLLAILFALFLLFQAIWPTTPNARTFLSGMADFTLIMFMLPLILVFLGIQIGMIGLGVYYIQWKRNMPESAVKRYGYLRVLLWQIEAWHDKARPYIDKASEKASNIAVSFNEKIAFVESWLTTIKKWIIRS